MRDFEWNMCGTAGSLPSSLRPPSGHLLAALMSTSKCLALENINLFLFPPVVSPESFRWVFLVSLQRCQLQLQPHPLNTYTHTSSQTIIAPYWGLAQSFNSIDSIGIVSVFYVHFAPTLSHISQMPVASCPLPVLPSPFPTPRCCCCCCSRVSHLSVVGEGFFGCRRLVLQFIEKGKRFACLGVDGTICENLIIYI